MRGVQLQDFIKDRFPAMIDYITVISSLVHNILILNYDGNQLDQLDVVNTLHQRSQHLADLEKESIPVLLHVAINLTSQSI